MKTIHEIIYNGILADFSGALGCFEKVPSETLDYHLENEEEKPFLFSERQFNKRKVK